MVPDSSAGDEEVVGVVYIEAVGVFSQGIASAVVNGGIYEGDVVDEIQGETVSGGVVDCY